MYLGERSPSCYSASSSVDADGVMDLLKRLERCCTPLKEVQPLPLHPTASGMVSGPAIRPSFHSKLVKSQVPPTQGGRPHDSRTVGWQTLECPSSRDDYQRIRDRLERELMGKADVLGIELNMNAALFREYERTRDRVAQQNDGKASEVLIT